MTRITYAWVAALAALLGCSEKPIAQDDSGSVVDEDLSTQISGLVCDDKDGADKLHDVLVSLEVGWTPFYTNGNRYALREPLTERELSHVITRLHGHTITISGGLLRVGPSLDPPPADPKSDSCFHYRFEIGETTYRITWERTRTYGVDVEQLESFGWRSQYTGTTMGSPGLRHGTGSVYLYLAQPHFQINEPQPPKGQEYYEVVTIDNKGVNSTVALLDRIEN